MRCLCSNPLEDAAALDIQIRSLIYSDCDEALATTAPRLLVETVRVDRATWKMSQRREKPEQEPLHAQLLRSRRNAQSQVGGFAPEQKSAKKREQDQEEKWLTQRVRAKRQRTVELQAEVSSSSSSSSSSSGCSSSSSSSSVSAGG